MTPEPAAAGREPLVRRWWPAGLALVFGLTVAAIQEPFSPQTPPVWLLPALAGAYLVFGAARGTLRRPRVLPAQLAALLVLTAVMVAAFVLDPAVARYLVAAAWLGHAVWDFAHHPDVVGHRGVGTVPRWYAEACLVIDLLIAAALLAAPAP